MTTELQVQIRGSEEWHLFATANPYKAIDALVGLMKSHGFTVRVLENETRIINPYTHKCEAVYRLWPPVVAEIPPALDGDKQIADIQEGK